MTKAKSNKVDAKLKELKDLADKMSVKSKQLVALIGSDDTDDKLEAISMALVLVSRTINTYIKKTKSK